MIAAIEQQRRPAASREDGRHRRALPLAVAAVVGALLIAALRGFVYDAAGAPENCLTLTLLSSSNKAPLLAAMAEEYGRADPAVDGRCVAVDVRSQASGVTADALVRGWDEAKDGPRPDVWSPASSAWIQITRHRQSLGGDVTVAEPAGLVAQSPQVIAMPQPMARQLGWPDRPIGWREVFELATDPTGWGAFGRPEWGPFRLGKTSIRHSTSALNATVASYLAATGTSGELTAELLADPTVEAFVRGIESSVEHYGDTSLTFLENLRRADDRGDTLRYLSAVILEEKSVLDYNRGNPSGDPSTLGNLPPPAVPLAAVYPKEGTLLADHPYSVLDLPSVGPDERRAAAAFLGFLQAPERQRRFQQSGFRDYQGRPGPEIRPADGLLPGGLVTRPLPEPNILDSLQRSWRGVRKRARVLILVDVSGSMSAPVGGSGTTKLGLVQRAVAASLAQFEGDDEVGLWLFTPTSAGGGPFQEAVPLGPYAERDDLLRSAVGSLEPQAAPSRLYATVGAALDRLETGARDDRITGVILVTDGPNEDRLAPDVSALLARVEAAATRGIQIYPLAYGANADRAVLRKVAAASHTKLYDASDPADIDDVLAAAVSNFGSPRL